MNSTDQNLIHYACVSKETSVVSEISFGDEDLNKLALQCLENTPQFHQSFSHTIQSKIYLFLMEDPFVYFGIFDEEIGKLQAFEFLERVKEAFFKISKKSLAKGFEEEFSSVFRKLVASKDLRLLKSADTNISIVGVGVDVNQNGIVEKAISVPLLGKVGNKSSTKKKRIDEEEEEEEEEEARGITIENKVDDDDDHIILTREFSASLQQKNASYIGKTGRIHVRIVLIADAVICSVLFGVWLFICKGFKCVA